VIIANAAEPIAYSLDIAATEDEWLSRTEF
jgi:hypothetical protein